MPFTRPAHPLVFAHRGGRALGPENTMPAFERGFAAGAEGFELDVHLSRDGRVVVCHDATLERTAGEPAAVADLTAAELAAVDASRRFGIDLELEWDGPRAGVPTLDEVLDGFPTSLVVVEIKAGTEACADAVVEAVRRAGALDRVCVGSFSRLALETVRAREPRLVTSAAREEGQRALYRSWVGLSPGRVAYRAFQVPEKAGRLTVVSPRFIRAAHRCDITVQVWTVNDEPDMRRLLDWGVDGLITDRPDLAVGVRNEWLRHRQEPVNL